MGVTIKDVYFRALEVSKHVPGLSATRFRPRLLIQTRQDKLSQHLELGKLLYTRLAQKQSLGKSRILLPSRRVFLSNKFPFSITKITHRALCYVSSRTHFSTFNPSHGAIDQWLAQLHGHHYRQPVTNVTLKSCML